MHGGHVVEFFSPKNHTHHTGTSPKQRNSFQSRSKTFETHQNDTPKLTTSFFDTWKKIRHLEDLKSNFTYFFTIQPFLRANFMLPAWTTCSLNWNSGSSNRNSWQDRQNVKSGSTAVDRVKLARSSVRLAHPGNS